jgi:4-amino-4-deoxy-L-arabinose transferase-like glycosyltransferase
MRIPMNIIRMACGLIMLLVGIAALVWFDSIGNFFLFLSPDGVVHPFMMLMLKLLLISLGTVGLGLLLYSHVFKLLHQIDVKIAGFDQRSFLLTFLITGFLLRLGVLLFMPFHLWSDYRTYDELGWQWTIDGGYYNGEGLTAYYPPAYPFFLSRLYLMFGHVPITGAVANIFFGMAMVLLAYLIVRKIWNESTARWTMLIMTFFPSQIFFTNLLASEMLFTPLFLSSILLCINAARNSLAQRPLAVGSGVLLGLATLTRAISKYYLIFIVLYWILQTRDSRRTIRLSLLALIGFAVVVTPWMIRNYYTVGSASINTNTGINLFIGNQPGSGMGYNSEIADQFDVNNTAMETYIDSVTWHRAWDYILQHPWAFVKRGVVKLGFFYAIDFDALQYGLLAAANESLSNYSVYLAFPMESYYLVVLSLASLGIIVFLARPHLRNPGGHLLLATVLYWSAVHFLFYGMGRYHFPIVPMLAAFAALYVINRVEKIKTAK